MENQSNQKGETKEWRERLHRGRSGWELKEGKEEMIHGEEKGAEERGEGG